MDTWAKSLAWLDSRALMVTRQESDDIVMTAVPRQVSRAEEGKKILFDLLQGLNLCSKASIGK